MQGAFLQTCIVRTVLDEVVSNFHCQKKIRGCFYLVSHNQVNGDAKVIT